MASGRKPVWLDEDAHLLIKQYAKLTKTSMTETTSQLVLKHIGALDGGSVAAAEPAKDVAPAPSPRKPAPAATPDKASASSASSAKKPPAARPKSTRKPASKSQDGVRYLGGIWIV